MKYLPEQFRLRVTVNEENKDFEKVRIEELVGSLQPCVLNLPQPKKTSPLP